MNKNFTWMKKWLPFSVVKISVSILIIACGLVWMREKRINTPEIWVGFQGTSCHDRDVIFLKKALEKNKVQGFLLFSHNIENPEQLKKLISFLKKDNPKITVAIDQEGGKVMRLTTKKGFDSGKMLALADYTSLDQCIGMHLMAAKEMHALGITTVLGPVMDVNIHAQCPIIGQLGRSFSKNPEKVVQYGQAVIDAYAKYGLRTCLKHAPGHGSATTDSHAGMTDITYSWKEEEMIPWIQCAKRYPGIAIMMGHLMHRHLDPEYPASLSKKIIQWMNQYMHNAGVKTPPFYVADAYEMRAVFEGYSPAEFLKRATEIGLSAVLFFCDRKYYPEGYSLQNFLKEKLDIVVPMDLSKERP